MQADIPEALLARRRELMMNEIQDDLGRQGVKWAEYESFMQEQGKLEEFMADLGKNAETRVKRDLALERLAQDLKVQLSEAEFNQTMNMLAQSNGMTPQQLSKQLGPDGIQSYYASMVRERALQLALGQLSGEKAEGAEAGEAAEAKPAKKSRAKKAQDADAETAETETAEVGSEE